MITAKMFRTGWSSLVILLLLSACDKEVRSPQVHEDKPIAYSYNIEQAVHVESTSEQSMDHHFNKRLEYQKTIKNKDIAKILAIYKALKPLVISPEAIQRGIYQKDAQQSELLNIFNDALLVLMAEEGLPASDLQSEIIYFANQVKLNCEDDALVCPAIEYFRSGRQSHKIIMAAARYYNEAWLNVSISKQQQDKYAQAYTNFIELSYAIRTSPDSELDLMFLSASDLFIKKFNKTKSISQRRGQISRFDRTVALIAESLNEKVIWSKEFKTFLDSIDGWNLSRSNDGFLSAGLNPIFKWAAVLMYTEAQSSSNRISQVFKEMKEKQLKDQAGIFYRLHWLKADPIRLSSLHGLNLGQLEDNIQEDIQLLLIERLYQGGLSPDDMDSIIEKLVSVTGKREQFYDALLARVQAYIKLTLVFEIHKSIETLNKIYNEGSESIEERLNNVVTKGQAVDSQWSVVFDRVNRLKRLLEMHFYQEDNENSQYNIFSQQLRTIKENINIVLVKPYILTLLYGVDKNATIKNWRNEELKIGSQSVRHHLTGGIDAKLWFPAGGDNDNLNALKSLYGFSFLFQTRMVDLFNRDISKEVSALNYSPLKLFKKFIELLIKEQSVSILKEIDYNNMIIKSNEYRNLKRNCEVLNSDDKEQSISVQLPSFESLASSPLFGLAKTGPLKAMFEFTNPSAYGSSGFTGKDLAKKIADKKSSWLRSRLFSNVMLAVFNRYASQLPNKKEAESITLEATRFYQKTMRDLKLQERKLLSIHKDMLSMGLGCFPKFIHLDKKIQEQLRAKVESAVTWVYVEMAKKRKEQNLPVGDLPSQSEMLTPFSFKDVSSYTFNQNDIGAQSATFRKVDFLLYLYQELQSELKVPSLQDDGRLVTVTVNIEPPHQIEELSMVKRPGTSDVFTYQWKSNFDEFKRYVMGSIFSFDSESHEKYFIGWYANSSLLSHINTLFEITLEYFTYPEARKILGERVVTPLQIISSFDQYLKVLSLSAIEKEDLLMIGASTRYAMGDLTQFIVQSDMENRPFLNLLIGSLFEVVYPSDQASDSVLRQSISLFETQRDMNQFLFEIPEVMEKEVFDSYSYPITEVLLSVYDLYNEAGQYNFTKDDFEYHVTRKKIESVNRYNKKSFMDDEQVRDFISYMKRHFFYRTECSLLKNDQITPDIIQFYKLPETVKDKGCSLNL